MFFVCNTDATIALEGATLVNASATLLVAGTNTAAVSVCGIPSSNVQSSWSGHGGKVKFTATGQTLDGDIRVYDTSSSLALTLTGSTLRGAINGDGIDTTVSVTLDAGSGWEVTGDSHLSALTNAGALTGSGKVFVSGAQVYPK